MACAWHQEKQSRSIDTGWRHIRTRRTPGQAACPDDDHLGDRIGSDQTIGGPPAAASERMRGPLGRLSAPQTHTHQHSHTNTEEGKESQSLVLARPSQNNSRPDPSHRSGPPDNCPQAIGQRINGDQQGRPLLNQCPSARLIDCRRKLSLGERSGARDMILTECAKWLSRGAHRWLGEMIMLPGDTLSSSLVTVLA